MRPIQTLRYFTRLKCARTLNPSLLSNRDINAISVRQLQCIPRSRVRPTFSLWEKSFRVTSILNSDTTIKVPPFAESVSEGDIRWEKQVGDAVSEDEVIAEIETDKTAVPVLAPCAGVITELLVGDGDKVVAGQDIVKMTPGAAPAASKPTEAAPPAEDSSAPPPPPPPSQPPSEPAAAPSVDAPQQIRPPADLSSMKLPQAAAPSTAKSTSTPAPPVAGLRGEQRIKMNRMRQRIAVRLKDAQNTCAMLTTFNEVDMSNLYEMRQKYKDQFQKEHGVKLGFMSAFVKASSYALKKFSIVNAAIDNNEIVYRDYVDISIAVATPKGLVVPVIRNVETMNYADIELTIHALGAKARDGTLAIEDMDGGTFTISNGGVFGSLMGTPIINPPQSAILGMHGVFDRPVAQNGQVVIKPMMYVALTYDHRLIDGREAVSFLRKVKSFVEDPRIMLLDL